MKVLSAAQIRLADAYTIGNEPIDSFSLMERASSKCFEWISKNIDSDKSFTIFCGSGNNGGDGLCLARLLKIAGRAVDVILYKDESQSSDFGKALHMADLIGIKIQEYEEKQNFLFNTDTVIIDAIFGTGMNRPVTGLAEACINKMNASGCEIISIDMPSGLIADGPTTGSVTNATYTLTFQNPKYALCFPESGKYAGEIFVLDIGLDKNYIDSFSGNAEFVSRLDVAALIRPRKKFSHKGDFGRSLLIAGSYGKIGAAVLAARSCLRTGAGILTVHIPSCGYDIMQTSIPEAMCETDSNEKYISEVGDVSKYDAIGVGPGIGTHEATSKMLLELIENFKIPMVLDADALNILSANKSLLKKLSPGSILTPHPGEFERMAGKSNDDFHRHKLQRNFSDENNVIVILKGAYTCIMIPGGKTYFNSTGNPGMAKGGSGDALTGILLGLLSQGYSSEHASLIGVYLHGLAGDLAATDKGEHSLLTSDLIESIPSAFRHLVLNIE